MIFRLFVIVAGIVLVAACESPPTDPARVTTSAPTSTLRDRAGAPPIRAPRDLASRAVDPCATLSSVELEGLGVRAPGVQGVDAIGAPSCTWTAGAVGSRTLEVSIVQTGDLFVDTYRNRVLPIFRPHEIDGLPAVDSKGIEDDTACTTTVGVADGQTLDVDVARGTFANERRADSCAISRRVAEAIVSTLPPL